MSVKIKYGRRKGARSRLEHFDAIIRSEEARQRGFMVDTHLKCPTLYYILEADVDDGQWVR